MADGIPPASRTAVEYRDGWLCQRCRHKGADWHHRRSRAVVDRHTHHPCNGVLLCRTCHAWAHANPDLARALGLVVSRYCEEPGMVPVWFFDGWWLLDCKGGGRFVFEAQVVLDEGVPMALNRDK